MYILVKGSLKLGQKFNFVVIPQKISMYFYAVLSSQPVNFVPKHVEKYKFVDSI